MMREKNVFELHLDECRQCREHSFRLCAAGVAALEAAIAGQEPERHEAVDVDERAYPN